MAQKTNEDEHDDQNEETGERETEPPDRVVFVFRVRHDRFIPFRSISISLIPRNGAMIPPTP